MAAEVVISRRLSRSMLGHVNGSILVARILGIGIRIHASWFVVFVIILLSLTDSVFPSMFPHWSDQKTLVVSAITALLFFGSVVAHELAHSIVARLFRMKVTSITLFLLGGVANLAEEPPSAKAEFLMAVAGPAMSLLIAGLGIGIAALGGAILSGAPSLEPVVAVAGYLGTINIAVAVFNLIPGFPLDGGRVLRSAIWGWKKDRARATWFAARGGQLVAGLLVVYAIWSFTRSGPIGLWYVLIAYFLYNAATATLQQERIGLMTRGIAVAPLMTTVFASTSPGTTVAAVVRDLMLPQSLRAVPVVAGSRFVGLATSNDVRKIAHDRWSTTTIDAVMTKAADLPSVSPEDPLGDAALRFTESPVLPVLRGGELVGLLDREIVASYLRRRAAAPR